MVGAPAGGIAMSQSVLHNLRARLGGWLALRVALLALASIAAVALLVVISDAAFDLPEGFRSAAPWLLVVAVVGVVAAGLLEKRRLSETRVARLFEANDASLGNRLINAIQLAEKTSEHPTGEFLRREAVRLGTEAAAKQKSWPVMRRSVQRVSIALASTLALWLLLALVGNDLLQSVLPRFLDAHGDHPPYNRLKIDVAPHGAEVIYGGQIELHAKTAGRPVDKLWLVARTGTNETRTVMFLAPDKTFFQTLVNLREPTEYFVTDGAARSRRFPVSIRYTPQISSVEMTEIFPEYTSKPAHTMKLSDDVQAIPEGTRVGFRLASNRPLKTGTLELIPVLGGKQTQITLNPEMQNVVTGAFTLSEPIVFNLSIRDVNGLDSAESRRGRLNVLPDKPPRIIVTEPGRDAVATPSIRVPVRIAASDDYAVSRVVWLRGFNRSIERAFNMKLTLKGGPQSVESTGAFDLEKLGVRPGDVIEYYFEAADNYPKGPNVAFSRPFKLEIISREQYENILRQAAAKKALFEPYFKLDAWLRRLAEHSRDLKAKADASDPATGAEAAELQKQLEEYREQLSKLKEQAIMFDVEQSFAAALVAQSTGVDDAIAALKKSLGSGQLGSSTLKDISDRLSALSATEEEQVEQPAQEIASVVRVLAKADAFTKLAQQQATVAQMLRRYADKSDALSRLEQMEVQELTHQEQLIHGALQKMLTELPELLGEVPSEPDYDKLRQDVQKFLQAVTEAKIEQDLADAFNALSQPDTVTGHGLAQRAAENMAKLVGQCDGMPNDGQQCLTARFQPKLVKPGLGNTLSQILAALGVGKGQEGRDGYSLFNEDVGLYGPNVELAGEQAGGKGQQAGQGQAGRNQRLAGDTADAALPPPEGPGHVRLQTDAKFPLRYRDIVGEYFRVIAESEKEGAK
jgi:hypothetical protein